jgi:hypothetical protein
VAEGKKKLDHSVRKILIVWSDFRTLRMDKASVGSGPRGGPDPGGHVPETHGRG